MPVRTSRFACLFFATCFSLLLSMSSAWAARVVIVDTDASQNPDYSSLSAAIAAEQGVLTEPLEIRARASSGLPDTQTVSLQGIETSASHGLTIVFEEGYALDITAQRGYTYAVKIKEDFVTLRGEGGQIRVNSNGYSSTYAIYSNDQSAGAKVTIENMRLEGDMNAPGSTIGIGVYSSNATHIIRNNVITGFNSIGMYLRYQIYVYNNTVAANHQGIRLPNGAGELYNNLSVGNVAYDYYEYQAWFGIATGHNISSDNTGPDASFSNRLVKFLDRLTPDYSLHPTDTAALDQGMDLISANYPPLTDIDLNPRQGSWDIGAYALDLATADADNDGMADRWETLYSLDAQTDDSQADLDGDGLSNLEEFQEGSSPLLADSDGDTVNDFDERANGTAPYINNQVRQIVVDTDATQNPDYASLAEALIAEQGILTQPLEIRARASSGIADTQAITIENFATQAEADVTIVFEEGYVLDITAPGNWSKGIVITSDHVTLRGEGGKFIFRNGGYTTGNGVYTYNQSANARIVIKSLHLEGHMDGESSISGITASSTLAEHIFRNNLITGFSSYGVVSHHQSYVYNNTILENKSGIYLPNFSGELYNNLVVNNILSDFYQYQDWSNGITGHNVSSDGHGPDSAYRHQTVKFLDTLIPDYSLHPSDTSAADQGAELSGVSFPFDRDIEGAVRNGSWDIGAYNLDLSQIDLDSDGMPDRWETNYGLNPASNDASTDADNDGLSNLEEYQAGASPLLIDSDGDSISDADEVANGTDPFVNNQVRVVIVDTDPSQNPEYTSLNAAIIAEQGILSQPLEIRARASSSLPDTQRVNIKNYVTTSQTDLTVVFEDGYALDYTATGNYTHALEITSEHVTLRGEGGQLILRDGGYSNLTGIYSIYQPAGAEVVIENMRVLGQGSASSKITGIKTYATNGGKHILRNNVVTGFGGAAGSSGMRLNFSVYVYNNTVAGNQTGIRLVNGSGELYNNLSVNNVGDDYDFQTSATNYLSGNNVSSDTSSPNTAFQNQSPLFSNVAPDLYALHANDTSALDQGIALSSVSYPFNTDILGLLRDVAWDIGAYSDSASVQNGSPVIAGVSPLSVQEGALYQGQVSASDPDNDTLSYSLSSTVLGLTIDSVTGELRWQTDYASAGNYPLDITVTDTGGLSASQSFLLIVENTNRAPTITSSPTLNGVELSPYTYTVQATDPDGESVIYALVNTPPPGMTINPNNGEISWLPNASQAGTYPIEVQAFDASGLFDSQSYAIVIGKSNRSPTATSQSVSTNEDTPLSIVLSGTDPDGDALQYSVVSPPQQGSLTGTAPNLSYQPNPNFNGLDSFTFTVNDGQVNSAEATVAINVNPVNTAPVIVSTPITTANEGELYQYQVVAADSDNDVVTYSMTSGPTTAFMNSDTGRLSWYPMFEDAGNYSVTVTASDGEATVTQTFSLTILNANRAPQITSTAPESVTENQVYQYAVTANDPDTEDVLNYTLSAAPDGMTIDMGTGLVTWVPENEDIGSHPIIVTVIDTFGYSDEQSFLVSVVSESSAPVITSEAITQVTEHQNYYYDVESSDPNPEDTHLYTTSGFSDNVSIDALSGEISWSGVEYIPSFSTSINDLCYVPEDDSQPLLNATDWAVLRDDGAHGGVQNWEILDGGIRSQAMGNGDPSILMSDIELSDAVVEINLRVEGGDNDGIGFVWGMQDQEHYYRFRWDQGNFGGVDITTINSPSPRYSGHDPTDIRLYRRVDIPWQQFVDYRIILDIKPGTASIYILDGNTILDSFIVRDDTYLSGRFGFYVSSQDDVFYSARLLPRDPTADLVVSDVTSTTDGINDTYTATVLNRGGGAMTATTELALAGANYNAQTESVDKNVFGRLSVPILEAGEQQTLQFVVPAIDETQYALVDVTVNPSGSDLLECSTDNNTKLLPLINVTVADSSGLSDDQKFTIDRHNINEPPLFESLPPAYAILGETYQYNVLAIDADIGDAIQYELIEGPTNMQFYLGTALLVWTPTKDDLYTTKDVTIRATDIDGLSVDQQFTITTQQKPVIKFDPFFKATVDSDPPIVARRSFPYQYQIVASDPENDELTYRLTQRTTGMSIDQSTGLISWTPGTAGQIIPVEFEVSDNKGGVATQRYSIAVLVNGEVNIPPIITSTPTYNAARLNNYQYQVVATDADGDDLRYRLLESPSAMFIDHSSGLIKWRPAAAQIGQYPVQIEVTDQRGGVVYQTYKIATDGSGNSGPVITSTPVFSVVEQEHYQYQMMASDPNNDVLTYALLTSPATMTIDPATGLIEWLPSEGSVGLYDVSVEVSDEQSHSAVQTYSIHVLTETGETGSGGNTGGEPQSYTPILINQPASIAFSGANYRYRLAGFVEHGGAVNVSLIAGPPGMTVTPNVPFPGYYEINWTPDEANCQHDVTLELSDAHGNTEQVTFTIDVFNAPKRLNRFQCAVDSEFCATR